MDLAVSPGLDSSIYDDVIDLSTPEEILGKARRGYSEGKAHTDCNPCSFKRSKYDATWQEQCTEARLTRRLTHSQGVGIN